MDLVQLLGMKLPDGVESSTLLTIYLTRRGPAIGGPERPTTDYKFVRHFRPVPWYLRQYIIKDDGLDVLGPDAATVPEADIRDRTTFAEHRHYLPNDWEFMAGQIGYLQHRNFSRTVNFEQEWGQRTSDGPPV